MKYEGSKIRQWAGDSQWRAWRADLARFRKHGYSGLGSEGMWALTIYRMQRGLRKWPRPAAAIPKAVLAVVKKLFTLVTHINLHPNAEIGAGLLIPHVGPIQVFPWAKIGVDCAIHQVCTIGAGARPGGPQIGDHVYIGCHTCILGPVKVGDRAVIGAGAVVVSDVAEGMAVGGVPAKALRKREDGDGVNCEKRELNDRCADIAG